MWDRLKRGLIETVYPRTCAGCNLRGSWLCPSCARRVPMIDAAFPCQRCGLPIVQRTCGCSHLHPNLVMVRSALPYTGWVREAIHRVKYQHEPARADHLGALLIPVLRGFGSLDGVIPVPLHARKLRDRGYNQAELIAVRAAGELGLPVIPMIVRHRETRSQVGLREAERRRNVADAFSLDPTFLPSHDARYAIVDDVRTTSATLNGCVRALAAVGITEVAALTVAADLRADQLEVVLAAG